jgi:hypothetical protein
MIEDTVLVPASVAQTIYLQQPKNFYGVYATGQEAFDSFWTITCPCEVSVTYPVNALPTVDTPHPCGNPDHWTVKIGESK